MLLKQAKAEQREEEAAPCSGYKLVWEQKEGICRLDADRNNRAERMEEMEENIWKEYGKKKIKTGRKKHSWGKRLLFSLNK